MIRCGNVIGWVEVSCLEGKEEGIENLKIGIKHSIEVSKLDCIEIPSYYMKVYEMIILMKTKKIRKI